MLRGIPNILSPELLKILMEMGHGDKIVIADGNFPAYSKKTRVINAAGHGCSNMLEAILKLIPLDDYIEYPICLMEPIPGKEPIIWEDYKEILKFYNEDDKKIKYLSREEFYEEAKNSYVIVATSEKALKANILLTKGVIRS